MRIGAIIGGIVALAVVTLCYWAIALLFVFPMGDCGTSAAALCAVERRQHVQSSLAIAVPVYLAISAVVGWQLFRRRE